jgi:Tfp pilus assembly protein PilX
MRLNRPSIQKQRGAVLLVTLIMLVVLTLFAVSGFNLSSVNLRIAGNFQEQRTMEAIALEAIERVLSNPNFFSLTPTAQVVNVYGQNVNVSAPRCNYTVTAKGYTKKIGELTPEDSDWVFRAEVADAGGARTAIVQGVRIRILSGNCPAPGPIVAG